FLGCASASSNYYYDGGAYSDDASAIPNAGVRAVIDVSSQPGPTGSSGRVTPYVSDDLSNDIWIQLGYTASMNQVPRGFYQIWNLSSSSVLTTGYFSVMRGPHVFAIYLKSGSTW